MGDAQEVPQVVWPCDSVQQGQIQGVLCTLCPGLILSQRTQQAHMHLRAN